MKKLSLILTITALISAGCSKEKRFSDLLTAHPWQVQAVIDNGIDDTQSCDLDDSILFLSGGLYQYDTGSLHCHAGEPDQVTGSWALDKDIITIVTTGGSASATIEELTDNTLLIVDGTDKFYYIK